MIGTWREKVHGLSWLPHTAHTGAEYLFEQLIPH